MTGDAAGAWRSLVTSALLGTDRAGEQAVRLPAEVVTAGEQAGLRLDGTGPAALLAAAALVDAARTAGRVHPAGAVAVGIAPAEDRPVARTSPATVGRLVTARGEELQEWLDLVRSHGLLVPPVALPPLLRLAVTDTALRAGLREVVGRRGVWLVGLDPALAPLTEAWAERTTTDDVVPSAPRDGGTAPDEDDVWRLGDLTARVRWLTDLRRRDPAAGRDALAGVLPGLPAAERAELLGALETGLGDDDEELLERSLDDRAAAPRRAAVVLLARLPRSAFTDRARRRAAARVRVARLGLRRHLVVELPEEPFDAVALRDGLTEPTTSQVTVPVARGHRAQRLHQLLAAAPLDAWVPGLAPTVEDLLRLPVADERADLVHDALAQAAGRAGDGSWAAALLRVAPTQAHRLVPLLPPVPRTRAVAALLRGTPDERDLARTVLAGWPRPWPADLVDAVVGAVRRTPVDAGWLERARARDLATALGCRADPFTTVVDPGDDALLQQATATLADRRRTIEETTA